MAKNPQHDDGVKNDAETGIDCGYAERRCTPA
jgi:hypothetical protein